MINDKKKFNYVYFNRVILCFHLINPMSKNIHIFPPSSFLHFLRSYPSFPHSILNPSFTLKTIYIFSFLLYSFYSSLLFPSKCFFYLLLFFSLLVRFECKFLFCLPNSLHPNLYPFLLSDSLFSSSQALQTLSLFSFSLSLWPAKLLLSLFLHPNSLSFYLFLTRSSTLLIPLSSSFQTLSLISLPPPPPSLLTLSSFIFSGQISPVKFPIFLHPLNLASSLKLLLLLSPPFGSTYSSSLFPLLSAIIFTCLNGFKSPSENWRLWSPPNWTK